MRYGPLGCLVGSIRVCKGAPTEGSYQGVRDPVSCLKLSLRIRGPHRVALVRGGKVQGLVEG